MRDRAAPIAVTGARGRLGRALLAAAPGEVQAWGRAELDLDQPAAFEALLQDRRPRLVIHAAAMTDVDGCAREPELALRRNGEASGALAAACLRVGAGLVLVSSNEVFDGQRTDGQGYTEDDQPDPGNPYGASKLAGEQAANEVFSSRPGLWIVRTAWLYGVPGNDFPDKIVAAADRLPADEPLPVVADEHGNPTSTADLAVAIHELVERSEAGLFHIVNAGHTSRLGWAERVLATRRPGRSLRPIPAALFERASHPPPWGVLDGTRTAQVLGRPLRPWPDALGQELSSR